MGGATPADGALVAGPPSSEAVLPFQMPPAVTLAVAPRPIHDSGVVGRTDETSPSGASSAGERGEPTCCVRRLGVGTPCAPAAAAAASAAAGEATMGGAALGRPFGGVTCCGGDMSRSGRRPEPAAVRRDARGSARATVRSFRRDAAAAASEAEKTFVGISRLPPDGAWPLADRPPAAPLEGDSSSAGETSLGGTAPVKRSGEASPHFAVFVG